MRGPIAIAIAIAMLAACGGREPYVCASSEQCVLGGAPGVCEPTGFCSFDDPACSGGRRYEPDAGDGLGGACIERDAGVPAGACGAVAQACCAAGPACIANGHCSGGTCARCVTDIALGRHAACVLKHDGTVWCAGENLDGQLGFGLAGPPVTEWVQARDATSAAITDATAVAAGFESACAVRANGTVWCWGRINGATSAVRVARTDDTTLIDIVEIAAGQGHVCGRDGAGVVWCWGSNGSGQLGDGTTVARPKAAPVLDAPMGPAMTGALALTVGSDHACVRKAGDAVWCWGRNSGGRLGDTTRTNRPNPVMVQAASSVAAGQRHTCAVRADGSVWCSGEAWRNRIGNGIGSYDNPPGDYPTPVQVLTARGGPPLMNITQVAAGGVSCALSSSKEVSCWGDNPYGQTGTGAGSTTPALVLTDDGEPLAGIERIVARGPHACAYREDGELLCWGRGIDGMYGDGTFANRGLARPLGFSCR